MNKQQLQLLAALTIMIAGIGVGLALFWQAGQNSKVAVYVTPSPTATPIPKPSPTPTPDPTAGWIVYADKTNHYSLSYPATWVKRTCVVGGQTTLYLGPTSAALGVCTSGFTGQMRVAPATGDHRLEYELGTDYKDIINQTLTISGVVGKRQSGTVAATAELGPAAGTKVVQYIFYTGGRTYLYYYSQAPTGPTATDVLADFDLMVKNTLTFTP